MKTDAALVIAGRTELKTRFIELRARGLSYSRIAKELNVSKGTLTAWNQELSGEIATLKAAQLDELYEKYYLLREGRIEMIGSQIKKMLKELRKRDFSEMTTEKLLDLVLRYTEAIKAEYIEPEPDTIIDLKPNAQSVISSIRETLNRYRSGQIDQERAQRETAILVSIVKAIETSELQARIEALEAVLMSRGQ